MKKRRVLRPKIQKNSRKKKKFIFLSIFASIILVLFLIFFYEKNEIKLKIKKNIFINNIPKGFNSVGIDVSHHQGRIDWSKLFFKNSFDTIIKFVYCKASEGVTHVDREWNNNRKWLLKNGIFHGAYHFFLPKENPYLQVKNFLKQWNKTDGDLPPMIDVEVYIDDEKLFFNNLRTWLFEVEKHTGMRPIIYTPLNLYENKFQNKFLQYKFWIASYSRKPNCINDERIIHWQYSESTNLPGINENVDANVSKINF